MDVNFCHEVFLQPLSASCTTVQSVVVASRCVVVGVAADGSDVRSGRFGFAMVGSVTNKGTKNLK